MHGPGSLETVKQDSAFGFPVHLRKYQHQNQEPQHHHGHEQTGCRMGFLGPAQVVPVFQKQGPDPDAENQTGQSQDRIQIPAGQAQQRPPGTSQKYQGPDHGKHAQYKSHKRGRPGSGPEVLERQGRGQ